LESRSPFQGHNSLWVPPEQRLALLAREHRSFSNNAPPPASGVRPRSRHAPFASPTTCSTIRIATSLAPQEPWVSVALVIRVHPLVPLARIHTEPALHVSVDTILVEVPALPVQDRVLSVLVPLPTALLALVVNLSTMALVWALVLVALGPTE
jgi:hypothetical protein